MDVIRHLHAAAERARAVAGDAGVRALADPYLLHSGRVAVCDVAKVAPLARWRDDDRKPRDRVEAEGEGAVDEGRLAIRMPRGLAAGGEVPVEQLWVSRVIALGRRNGIL